MTIYQRRADVNVLPADKWSGRPFYGRRKSFKKIDRHGIGIVGVRPDDIPDDALVAPGTDGHHKEIRVHADIPVAKAKFYQPKNFLRYNADAG